MNSVDNFKSTKLRKLFRILKSSSMQSLNIFRAREGFLFEFASLSGVWKFENIFCWARPTYQRPVSILTAQDGCPVPHPALFPVATLTARRAAWCRWPPVVVASRGLAPISLLQTSSRKPPPTLLLPRTVRPYLLAALLCSAPATALPTVTSRR
jgi:hypothetical protein